MVPYFPKQVSLRAVSIYTISLITVYVMYISYSMSVEFVIIGILSVSSFFFFSSSWTKKWAQLTEKKYIEQVFLYALLFRLIWILFSYFYYQSINGSPFEFAAADSMGYHNEAVWLASEPWSVTWDYYFGPGTIGVSDVGYPLYLAVLYRLFGPVIIIPRLLKALMSAFMCLLVYRLSARTFGEETGRIAGIMCALMPNLIYYCGYHLKETEMMFVISLNLSSVDAERLSIMSVIPLSLSSMSSDSSSNAVVIAEFETGFLLLTSIEPSRQEVVPLRQKLNLTGKTGTRMLVESVWIRLSEAIVGPSMQQVPSWRRWPSSFRLQPWSMLTNNTVSKKSTEGIMSVISWAFLPYWLFMKRSAGRNGGVLQSSALLPFRISESSL